MHRKMIFTQRIVWGLGHLWVFFNRTTHSVSHSDKCAKFADSFVHFCLWQKQDILGYECICENGQHITIALLFMNGQVS